LSIDHINKKGKIIFIISDSSSDFEGFISSKKFEIQFQFSQFFPPGKRSFYASDSNDKKIILKISDKGIDGDEGVNIKESIKKDIKKDIEKFFEEGIEKSIKEGIKEVIEQTIEEIVEEVNMKKGIRDPPKFRRSDRNKK
jgi:hypothetical protein